MVYPSKSAIKVVGIGVSTVDILNRIEHFPCSDEVQETLDTSLQGGGPVATAIVTLAQLGVSTAMLDVIGDDWRSEIIRQGFEQTGVCTDYLISAAGHTASTSTILVQAGSGSRAILFSRGTSGDYPVNNLPTEIVRRARFLHINGRHMAASLAAIDIIHAAGGMVSFDGGAQRYKPGDLELLPKIDLAIVAFDYAQNCLGGSDPAKAAVAMSQKGPQIAVVTDGIRGSWVAERSGPVFHQPAFRLPQTIDTTGCGDSYHGGFIYGMLQGWNLPRCAQWASAVAAINSQTLGGRAGLPNSAQVEAFLAANPSTAD